MSNVSSTLPWAHIGHDCMTRCVLSRPLLELILTVWWPAVSISFAIYPIALGHLVAAFVADGSFAHFSPPLVCLSSTPSSLPIITRRISLSVNYLKSIRYTQHTCQCPVLYSTIGTKRTPTLTAGTCGHTLADTSTSGNLKLACQHVTFTAETSRPTKVVVVVAPALALFVCVAQRAVLERFMAVANVVEEVEFFLGREQGRTDGVHRSILRPCRGDRRTCCTPRPARNRDRLSQSYSRLWAQKRQMLLRTQYEGYVQWQRL